MNKTLKLLRAGFVSSSTTTPEFKAFASTFKKELKTELESVGAKDIKFNVGHFYISGFYTIGTQPWYFSISDVRFFPDERLLYRTAGSIQYAKIEAGMARKMHRI